MSLSSGSPEPDSTWTWRLLDNRNAMAKWLKTEPPISHVTATLEWLRGAKLLGPPDSAKPLDGGRFVAAVADTPVVVEYYTADYERLIILREIR